jgi:O-antigen/teichoic acid export membrane protein
MMGIDAMYVKCARRGRRAPLRHQFSDPRALGLSVTRPGAAHDDRGEGPIRRRVGRGVIVNGVFLALVNGLGLLRALIVVALIGPSDYGVWGILAGTLAILLALRQTGIADRYVQQDDGDQAHAFQIALTLQIALSLALLAAACVVMPVISAVYGEPSLLAPGLVLALMLPGLALQTPLAIFHRRLDFARQRLLQSIDPIVAFAVTVPLVAAGAGYWGVVAGAIAGAWAAGGAALWACPYPLRLRWEAAAARRYAHYSWPMLAAAIAGGLMAQALLLGVEESVGLTGAGILALSLTISQWSNRIDQITASTLYPALCAVRDRRDLLVESVAKSSAVGLLWGAPAGLALILFAPALVAHGLGPEWTAGVAVLQATGAVVVVHRIGYAWDSVFRAVGRTREIALNAGLVLGGFLALGLPLILAAGLEGAAAALLVLEALALVSRMTLLQRILPAWRAAAGSLRAAAPALTASAVLLLVRLVAPGDGSLARAAVELAVFTAVTVAGTLVGERALLRELRAYMRRTAPAPETVLVPA